MTPADTAVCRRASSVTLSLFAELRLCASHHRVVLPGEHGQAVLVLAELLLHLGPHAFGLTLQRDEDHGVPDQLHQVQEALPVQAKHTRTVALCVQEMATVTSCGRTAV